MVNIATKGDAMTSFHPPTTNSRFSPTRLMEKVVDIWEIGSSTNQVIEVSSFIPIAGCRTGIGLWLSKRFQNSIYVTQVKNH